MPYGCGDPVFRSDGPLYAPASSSVFHRDDPHPAAFVFIQVEQYLDEHPTHKAIAWNTYVQNRDPDKFRHKEGDSWTISSRKLARLEHNKLKDRISQLVEETYELSIAEQTALDVLKTMREKRNCAILDSEGRNSGRKKVKH